MCAELDNTSQKYRGASLTQLLIILCIALVLRLIYLKAQTFYIDEAFNYTLAKMDFASIIKGSASESNPPLPVLLSHFWVLVSNDIVWLRTMPLLFSLGAVCCTYFIGARAGGQKAATLSALMMAAAPSQLYFSHVFRYPAMAVFTGALCTLFFVMLIFDGNRKMMVPFILACTAALVTHYFFVFLMLAFNAGYFFHGRRGTRVPFTSWIISQTAILLFVSPWIKYAGAQGVKELSLLPSRVMISQLSNFPFKGTVNVVQSFISGMYPIWGDLFFIFVVSAWVVSAAAVFILYCIKNAGSHFYATALFICIGVPYAMMFTMGLRINPHVYFCMFSPVFFVLLSVILLCGVKSVSRYATVLCTAVIFALSLNYYFTNAVPKRDNATAISYILTHQRRGDILVVNPTYQGSLIDFLAQGKIEMFGIPRQFDILSYNFNDVRQVTTGRLEELDRLVPPGGRVWAFFSFGTKTKPDQGELTVKFLDRHFTKEYEMRFSPASFTGEPGRMMLYIKNGAEKIQ